MCTHFKRLADAGVGIYVGGSSPGEQYALSHGEVATLLGTAVEAVKRQVPVRAMGVEPRHAGEMIALIKLAEEQQLDGVQIYSLDIGHGITPTNTELEHYFRQVLEACTLPAVVSSHISNGYLVPIDMIERLVTDYQQLIGVNITTPDIWYLSEAAERLSDRIEIHIGGPMHAITGIALRGNGYLSGEANIAPELCQSLIDRFLERRQHMAFEDYAALMALMRATRVVPGGYARRIKAAMQVIGRSNGVLREPFAPLTEQELAAVRHNLEKVVSTYHIRELHIA